MIDHQYGEFEGYELVFSVQVGEARILELRVDDIFSGSIWQLTDPSGQVIRRSHVYQSQAECLRDGLNHNYDGYDND